ncbi:hypothetical protein ATANTOWER_004277 [Ataeniobius toweri]|uniref:Uncharacterized protein n=1 Tax=Ataeniobius toweri TaxID=208326 RepID=A0ABU7CHN3_9TELE|nr:hypothetical protein [Ataeniobius toweri]
MFPFIETNYIPLLPLLTPPLAAPVGVDAEPTGSDWPPAAKEMARRTNDDFLWLVHQSEVMWSGGGLKGSLISVHTITLQQRHDRLLHTTSTGPTGSTGKKLWYFQ